MVLTTQTDTSYYPPASLETAQLANERLYYSKVDSGRVNKSMVSGYPGDTYTNPNDYIQQLSGSGVKVGAGIVLKVMAGDKFNIRTGSWYKTNHATPGTPVNLLNDLLGALTGGVGTISAAHGGLNASQIASSGAPTAGVTQLLNKQGAVYNDRNPKAFINWIMLDERFKCYEGYFEQVGNDQEFKVHVFNDEVVGKNGYLYIYVSNETPNINVFFDNLQVTHIRGPLLEENSYYPFGLLQKNISYRPLKDAYPENKLMFNDGTEFARKEFNDGSGLELYETPFRGYDPQIGKFWQVDPLSELADSWSPFAFSLNNPILISDPLGLSGDTTINGVTLTASEAQYAVTVTNTRLPIAAFFPPLPPLPNLSPASQSSASPSTSTTNAAAITVVAGATTAEAAGGAAVGEAIGASSIAPPIALALGFAYLYSRFAPPPGPISVPLPRYGPVDNVRPAPPIVLPLSPSIPVPKVQTPEPVGEQYTLRAVRSGSYPVFKWGLGNIGTVWLNKGDIWKIGTTINGTGRYTDAFYKGTGAGLDFVSEFKGPMDQVLFVEKMKLLNYVIQHNGEFPPGNTKLQ